MARWLLKQKHYLNVPGTEWDYKETTDQGRQKRIVLPVPLYLDPDNPGDQNYPGEVIVAHAGSAQRADYIFEGNPTPDMEPLDDEAREVSAALEKTWQHPINSLGDGGYGQKLEQILEKMIIGGPTPAATPSMDDFIAMQAQVKELIEQNVALTERLGPERRV